MLLVLVVYAIVNFHWVATPDLYHGEIIYQFTTPTAYRLYCRTRYTKILLCCEESLARSNMCVGGTQTPNPSNA